MCFSPFKLHCKTRVVQITTHTKICQAVKEYLIKQVFFAKKLVY